MAPPARSLKEGRRGTGAAQNQREENMRHNLAKLCALAAFALGLTTVTAEAANCQGRRDTGTAVGAIRGGLVGNPAPPGKTGGTIARAVICGGAGHVLRGHPLGQTSPRPVFHPAGPAPPF